MVEKIDPIRYAENLMKAWKDNDTDAVDAIEGKYGDQEVNLKDLEQMFAYVMSVLSTAYAGKDLVDQTKYDKILDILEHKEIINSEERKEIDKEIKEVEKTVEGE